MDVKPVHARLQREHADTEGETEQQDNRSVETALSLRQVQDERYRGKDGEGEDYLTRTGEDTSSGHQDEQCQP